MSPSNVMTHKLANHNIALLYFTTLMLAIECMARKLAKHNIALLYFTT